LIAGGETIGWGHLAQSALPPLSRRSRICLIHAGMVTHARGESRLSN
jgi:hypothetical protein